MERPILFSAPMVRAILEGRKTQTRRVLKIRGVDGGQYAITSPAEEMLRFDDGTFHYRSTGALSGPYACSYGHPGDRLWVRETWNGNDEVGVAYRATNPEMNGAPWRSPIFMPRWASRITLEVTEVSVQRVQDIGEEDALAEGINRIAHGREGYYYHAERTEPNRHNWCDPIDAFRELWDSINAKRGFGWEANPWTWAMTFRRLEQPHA